MGTLVDGEEREEGKLRLLLLLIGETAHLPIPKQFYQFSNPIYFNQKTGCEKSLPTRNLVNKNEDKPRPDIKSDFLKIVRKTDECISELCGELLRMRTLVSGMNMPFAGVFGFSLIGAERRLKKMN